MPSPFPGMDPFLEHPEVFPDLHDRLMTRLSESLQAQLPPPYFAVLGSRVWVDFPPRRIGPDVQVRRPASGTNGGDGLGDGASPLAVATRTPPVVVQLPEVENREPFVEIYTPQGGRRLVTVVELLSLANKTPGEHGRNQYLQKQTQLLRSQVNLVEIDFLRTGQPTTAVPHELAVAQAGPFDYHVCVRLVDRDAREHFLVYPIQIQARLPEIVVPLLPGDPAVALDLQAVMDHCYDAGPYRRWVPYADNDPAPPLPPEQAAWATQRLRDHGLLPAASE